MAEPQGGRGRGRAVGHAREEKKFRRDILEAGEPIPGPSGLSRKTLSEKSQSKGSKSSKKQRPGQGDQSGKLKDKSKRDSQRGTDDVRGHASGVESNGDESEDNRKHEPKDESQDDESQDESQDESEDGSQDETGEGPKGKTQGETQVETPKERQEETRLQVPEGMPRSSLKKLKKKTKKKKLRAQQKEHEREMKRLQQQMQKETPKESEGPEPTPGPSQPAAPRPLLSQIMASGPAASQSAPSRPAASQSMPSRPAPSQSMPPRPAASQPMPSTSAASEPMPSGSAESQPVESCRPLSKKGTSGKPVNLLANYFELETLPDWTIYQYRVDFNVDEEREFQKKAWLKEHSQILGHSYIFDGGLLFTARRLTVENQPLTLTSIRDCDKFPVRIEIKFVQQLKRGNSVYLQVFNILVRRSLMNLQLQLVHRHYFDARAAIHLPEYNLEIWPGYITSIRQNEHHILMCSEITHKIMRKDTARDLLVECIRTCPDYRASYAQAIVGQVVLTDYNNRTYRIDDVDYAASPASKFKLKTKDEISFMTYYDQRYRITIRDTKQPLLVSRCSQNNQENPEKNCLLIPELCRMTGLDEKMSENAKLKKALSEHTRVNPFERMKKLLHFNCRLQQNPSVMQEFSQWEMRLSKKLITVPARELPPETIVGGRGQKYSAGVGTDWIREVRSRPMLKTGVVRDWSVICPCFLAADATAFLESLRKAAAGMDFRLPPPKMFQTPTDRPAHFMDAVESVLAVSKPDIIMFVCTNNRSDRYNAIKRKCCVDRAVQSQVILAKNLKSKSLSVATKVAIQLNCKLGGAPWSVDIPLQSVMVVGYDVCHDAQYKDRSYGAVVASLNSTLSSWFSTVSQHTNGDELTSALAADIEKALERYREVNGSYPARIFVYRDGVGEGQINFVREHEVNFLKSRLTRLYGGEHWKLGYIIVSKRINTRLFKENSNPRPGTIVDDVITLPDRYDFFLVSQSVNVGTVTPTNYNVISDNLGLKPDQIQRWTYKMTHLYYNWSGTVRVPAPCQYAHKLAFLVGQSLHVPANPALNSSLYFL